MINKYNQAIKTLFIKNNNIIFKKGYLTHIQDYFSLKTSFNLLVIGVNIASLKSKENELNKLLRYKEPDVVLLNETWLTNDYLFNNSKYFCLTSEKQQNY